MSDINELRAHLFTALNGLADKENPLDIERAKAIAEVSQTIINSAKVEVEYFKSVGGTVNSEFIQGKSELPPGVTGKLIHKLGG